VKFRVISLKGDLHKICGNPVDKQPGWELYFAEKHGDMTVCTKYGQCMEILYFLLFMKYR